MRKLIFDIKDFFIDLSSQRYEVFPQKNFTIFGVNIFTIPKRLKITYMIKNFPVFSRKVRFFNMEEYIEYDNIIIFNTHLGEAHFFVSHLLIPFLRKNSDKKTLLVFEYKNFEDLIDMFNLDCPYKVAGKQFEAEVIHLKLKKPDLNIYKMNSFDFDRTVKHVTELQSKYFHIDKNEMEYQKINVSEDVVQRMLEKVKKTKLNLDNFIFIAPESSFFRSLDNKFWKKLINKLKQKGYDIYMNSKWFKGKNTKLTLQEAYALADISKGIISVRSGFSEVLTQASAPLFSLVKNCRPLFWNEKDNKEWHNYFDLLKYPDVDKSKTFNFDLRFINDDEVIDSIIHELEKRKNNSL